MRVKLNQPICGAFGSFGKGHVADLAEEFAGPLVASGVAEWVDAPERVTADVREGAAPDTATPKMAPERAAKRGKR